MGIFDVSVKSSEYVNNKDGTFTKWVKQGVIDTNKLKAEKELLEGLQALSDEQIGKIVSLGMSFDGKTVQKKIEERIAQITKELENCSQ